MYQSGKKIRIRTVGREKDSVMFKILAVLLVVLSACVGSGELHTAVDESGCHIVLTLHLLVSVDREVLSVTSLLVC